MMLCTRARQNLAMPPAKIGVFMDFLAISGCETHFKSELH